MALFQLLLLAAILATRRAAEHTVTNQIHLLMPRSGFAGSYVPGLNCASWRLGVETNNVRGWSAVPKECEGYVGHYMLGHQYRADSKRVTDEASLYAKSIELSGDGRDVWIFDVDETVLSNLPYYGDNKFGADPYNGTSWNDWVLAGEAPALPESYKLYNGLLSVGIKIIFLTGRNENQRNATTCNLKNAGFHTFEQLILRSGSYIGTTAVYYKSSKRAELENDGYRFIGSMGDQWSDLLGTNTGKRTFKLPDPMYYLS